MMTYITRAPRSPHFVSTHERTNGGEGGSAWPSRREEGERGEGGEGHQHGSLIKQMHLVFGAGRKGGTGVRTLLAGNSSGMHDR